MEENWLISFEFSALILFLRLCAAPPASLPNKTTAYIVPVLLFNAPVRSTWYVGAFQYC